MTVTFVTIHERTKLKTHSIYCRQVLAAPAGKEEPTPQDHRKNLLLFGIPATPLSNKWQECCSRARTKEAARDQAILVPRGEYMGVCAAQRQWAFLLESALGNFLETSMFMATAMVAV